MEERTCDVCGTKTVDYIICCSPLGAFTNCYCRRCHNANYEPYNDIVSCVWACGGKLNDVAPWVKTIIDSTFKEFNISVEKLLNDVALMDGIYCDDWYLEDSYDENEEWEF